MMPMKKRNAPSAAAPAPIVLVNGTPFNLATAGTTINVATTHYVILRGACQFVGFTGVGDTVTRIYGAGPAPNSGMFLSTAPAG